MPKAIEKMKSKLVKHSKKLGKKIAKIPFGIISINSLIKLVLQQIATVGVYNNLQQPVSATICNR